MCVWPTHTPASGQLLTNLCSQQACELKLLLLPSFFTGETEVEINNLPPNNFLVNVVNLYEKDEAYFFG